MTPDKDSYQRFEFKKPKPKKVGRPEYLTPRDSQILRYLWRWKVSSTASIHESINRPQSEYSTYKILEKLERSGFVTSQFDWEDQFYVWFLTSKGFSVIRKKLENMVEDGFLSENHNHDRLVQALQLGEWATHQNPKVSFWTEQEMRRFDSQVYPDWVPTSKEHRPDGYTKIIGDKKQWTFAFEVELSAKSISKYEATMQFYKHARQINRVYWLVSDSSIQEIILRAKKCINDESMNYHVFINLSDFKKNGWDATIYNERSERVHTIRENMQVICGDFYGEILGNSKGRSTVSVHLNKLKVLGKSKT
jgi:DNA-binding MarR family transcriptional regulator